MGRVRKGEGSGAARAPAYWDVFGDAALVEGAVGLALIWTRVDLGTRHGGAVLSPGQDDTVRTETPSHTNHTDLRARGGRLGGSQEEQRGRRCRTIWTDKYTEHRIYGTLLD